MQEDNVGTFDLDKMIEDYEHQEENFNDWNQGEYDFE